MQFIQSSLLGLVLSLLALACSGGSEESYSSLEYTESLEVPKVEEVSKEKTTGPQRKLIRNARLEFQTQDLEQTRKLIQQTVQKYGGYLGAEQSSNYESRQSTTVQIRIPADHFEKFIADISSGVKTFDEKNISSRDVTEEFMDVQARLKNKKELETRYQQILQQAKNVKEILEIERELNNLRSDIESMEGRLNYLTNQVELSTIEIRYYKEVTKSTAFGQKFSQGFRSGWTNLIWFMVGLVNIWPFLILLALGAFGLKRYLRKRKLNRL